jgi:hypothetical protein
MVLAACSTVASRIDKNRAVFNSYPPDVQQKIQAGTIDIGFTPEQVHMALGDPDHRYTREASDGRYEIWGYRDSRPSFSFGIGGGSFGRSTGFGGGVGVATGNEYPDDKIRVVFQEGKVSAIERSASQ